MSQKGKGLIMNTPSVVPEMVGSSGRSQKHLPGAAWGLALLPLLALGLVLTYIVITGGGLSDLTGPPVEQVKVQRIILPQPGVIQVEVVNDGPQAVTIA